MLWIKLPISGKAWAAGKVIILIFFSTSEHFLKILMWHKFMMQGKNISEWNDFNYIFKMCCYVRRDKAQYVAKPPVISKWNSKILDVDNVGMKIYFGRFLVYLGFLRTHIYCKMLSINKSAFPAGEAAPQKFFSQFPSLLLPLPLRRGSALQHPRQLTRSSNIWSGAHIVHLVCSFPHWSAPLLPFPSPPLLISLSSSACAWLLFPSSRVIPSLQSLICPHTALCATGRYLPPLWAFSVPQKRKDISKLVFYLSFWVKTVVRNRGSKFWATKGADEHRRLSRRDCQFWAGALNLKMCFCGRQALFGSVLYICYFIVLLSETNVCVK